MLVIIGFLIVFGSILVGYTMHGGNVLVLWQVSEIIIIGGAGFGALLIGTKAHVVKALGPELARLLKANPYGRETYSELLQVLYEIFYTARRDGLVGIENHIEEPADSELFKRYPSFHQDTQSVAFLSDTMKVLLSGTVEDHHLTEILDLDVEQYAEEAEAPAKALATIADAMPGFGIVAAVLGVIITMGHIGGSPEEIGHSVAAALVGTFLGVLAAYGVVGPLAQALESRARSKIAYLTCIRTAILSFARGDAPVTSVEFARRSIEPDDRPSFQELESMTRRKR